jgi:hypothetical protein
MEKTVQKPAFSKTQFRGLVALTMALAVVLLLMIVNLNNQNAPAPTTPPAAVVEDKKDMTDPVIKNLGVKFGHYDAKTGQAGDFVFDKTLGMALADKKIFTEFGVTRELSYNMVNKDAPVTAVADAKVSEVKVDPESADFTVSLTYNDNWTIVQRHLRDVKVKRGESVKAGQVLGKVALNVNGKTGYTSIELREGSGRGKAASRCPWMFLSPTIENDVLQKYSNLMSQWETFMGDIAIYTQDDQPFPGCVATQILAQN